MKNEKSGWEQFFGVAAQGQTYQNLLYLLLAFPLGLFYFVFLVTGLSLGVGLFILWIGILILVAMFAAWVGLAQFERWMAIKLLRVEIPSLMPFSTSGMNFWQKFKSYLSNPGPWKGLLFLFLKFPMGILSFVVVVTLISVSGAFIMAPVLYPYGNIHLGGWALQNMTEAVGLSLVGIFLLFASLHVFNGLAYVSGQLARILLGVKLVVTTAGSAPSAEEPISSDQTPIVTEMTKTETTDNGSDQNLVL